MTKFILALVLITGFWTRNYPNDISGKWQVKQVDTTNFETRVSVKQKEMVMKYIKRVFMNSVFEFRSDHHFFLSPETNLMHMPKGGSWRYNSITGEAKIIDASGKGTLIAIKILEKNDTTFFSMKETPILLKMIKISNQ